jgi:hypothetical protein
MGLRAVVRRFVVRRRLERYPPLRRAARAFLRLRRLARLCAAVCRALRRMGLRAVVRRLVVVFLALLTLRTRGLRDAFAR